ncbi:MAG: hypothetical protein JRI92_08435 [Deltaproteobacteria bacterium]|nr:hypothetical protein [Deltaproteobacteria bacterium]
MNRVKILFISFIILFGLLVAVSCRTPGTYFIGVKYAGDPETSIQGTALIGMQSFLDKREEESKNYIGARIVGKDQKELFLSSSLSVADSVTSAFKEYAVKRGFEVKSISGWDFSPEGMRTVDKGLKYVVGGHIEKLRCDATKRVGRTSMVLEIKIITYVGSVETGSVKKRPFEIKLTRTDPTFGASGLEKFVNEALAKIIANTLADLN